MPDAVAIAAANAKDAQQREILSTLPLGAGAASSVIALASVGPMLLTWALTNPDVNTAKIGDVLLYKVGLNTFAVRTSDRVPRTMFRPDPSMHGYSSNIEFWKAK